MSPTQRLHDLGQSIWLDNITRGILNDGTLARYVREWNVTGLTSNPSIFEHALKQGTDYDEQIRAGVRRGVSPEDLFFELALADLTRAADLFKSVHESTNRMDGWVSVEVAPTLAYDTRATIASAKKLHVQGNRPNLYVKIPGTPEGVPAIEEATFAGVSVNVTLLFSREQYLAAADAYLRGIERRIAAGLNPLVPSVASVFISRWDVATADKVPADLRNRLGIAIAQRTFKAYLDFLNTPRCHRALNFGAMPQRLLWGSTGTKDPKARDTLYVENLAAPFTINTMPDNTLKALADHGEIASAMAWDGGDAKAVLSQFVKAGIDIDALALKLQKDGAEAFVKSWQALLERLQAKIDAIKKMS